MLMPVAWSESEKILTVPSQRSLRSVRERIRRERPDWVVIRRVVEWQPEPFFYAFSPAELLQFAEDHLERLDRPIAEGLELHEHGSSPASRGRHPIEVELGGPHSPSSVRAVHLDAQGQPVAVSEPPTAGAIRGPTRGWTRGGGEQPVGAAPDLGPTRGATRGPTRGRTRGEGEPAAAAAPDEGAPDTGQQVEVTLSAQAKEEIQIGAIDLVDFRIELKDEALPLRDQLDATISTDRKVRVLITVHGTTIEALDPRIQEVDPPAAGEPTLGVFEIRGVEPGTAEIALLFRQGGTQLGSIRFTVAVVAAAAANTRRVSGSAVAAPRDPADDAVLTLLIDQRQEGNQIRYEYKLHSEALGLNYVSLNSNPLLDRGGGAAATTLAYIEGVYQRVMEEVLSWDDARLLARKVHALGTSMSQELLDPEVSRRLWAVRDRLKTVQVTSWEPYIPWELLCLKNPDTGEADERFLCEYGLIRALPGEGQPRTLRLERWSYLAADYEHGTETPVGAEADYFTETLPRRGIQPTRVRGEYDAFFDALEEGNFDVLHLACHGESQHQKIEDAVLIIGDEIGPGGEPRHREVDARTVEQLARLKERRPVIFLNACESGRHGPSLTAWGGWPTAFLKAGAGVFVGTSWPVREKPASQFAHAFYDALLQGQTLAEAATEARSAIKNAGDASWLAFKVYGNPRARITG